MKEIKELKSVLDIEYDNRIIKLLTLNYMDKYIDILRSEYFNKSIDFKFNLDISLGNLQKILYKLITSYKFGIDTIGPARLILMDNESRNIVGGCSIFECSDNVIELAYFIEPRYQHNNECYNMLKNILNALNNSEMSFKAIRLYIQENNIASIKLAERLEFNKTNIVKGKYCNNIIMEKERSDGGHVIK